MRKSEIIRQRDFEHQRYEDTFEMYNSAMKMNESLFADNISLREDIKKIREHAKSVIDENESLRKDNRELFEKIRKLERKETSFQEDLEFFVNDCTEAQARELYERLKKRFDNGPYVLCKDGTKARVGDEVQVIISTMNSIRSNMGIIDSILFDNDECKCVRFDLKVDNGARLRLWTDDKAVRVFLLARREEKNA